MQFTVSLNTPPGMTDEEAVDFLEGAIKCYPGSLSPDDLGFKIELAYVKKRTRQNPDKVTPEPKPEPQKKGWFGRSK